GSQSGASSRVRRQPGVPPPDPRGLGAPPPPGGNGGSGFVAGPPGGAGAGGGAPLLAGVRITPDVVNNTLLIFASQEHYRIIERTIRQMDRPQMPVSIDPPLAHATPHT